MGVLVKICGVNSASAFDAAGCADWVGFVFFAKSPRYVTPVQAAALSRRLDSGPRRVGLFVDPTDDTIAHTLETLHLDALQLYAEPARIAAIAEKFGVPVWQALGIGGAADLPHTAGAATRLVIETRPPPGADRPGGNAAPLDWHMLAGWQPGTPWMLAGGLTPANVAEAVRRSGARAVDVSSGVESAPGVKDAALIRAFLAAAQAASARAL